MQAFGMFEGWQNLKAQLKRGHRFGGGNKNIAHDCGWGTVFKTVSEGISFPTTSLSCSVIILGLQKTSENGRKVKSVPARY